MALNIEATLLSLEEKKGLSELLAPTSTGVGGVPSAVAGSVGVAEQGSSGARTTVLTLNGMPLTVRDTQQGGGVKIYTFPLGKIFRLGASAENIVITTTSDVTTTLNTAVT